MSKLEGMVIAALVCTLAGCASMMPKPEEQPDDGLLRVETAMLDELYVAPNVSLAHYKRVMVDPVAVSFKDGWRMQHPGLSEKDLVEFKAKLSDMWHDTLVAELARGGYTLAEDAAPDVLRITTRIVDTDFAAPELGIDRSTFVYVDGSMTLKAQGFDGPSGALVARVKDHEIERNYDTVERADRTSALVKAQQMFDKWAQEIRSALDVAKVRAGARTPQR